ncbi:MAG: flagellar assembly protein FliW [Acidobacteria bacterium]|nr:flagellar assembly protein FliW [Acidobacteriota bacterium]
MPWCETKYLGNVEYEDTSVVEFPLGLFGFESEKRFLLLEPPGAKPIVLLQSVTTSQLCFIALPILVVDRAYRPALSPEDLAVLGMPVEIQPRIGDNVFCLALITIKKGRPTTANLLAPLVINLRTLRAVQSISTDSSYSHQQVFLLPEEEPACS